MSSFTIAGYEVRRLLRDRALPLLLTLLLGLSGFAAWNGADWVRQREGAIDLIKAEEHEQREGMRRFVGASPVVLPREQPVLPPGDMAAVSIGQADAYPFTADLIGLGDYTMLFKRVWADIGSPTVRAAGRFDLAFVIVFLLPLVILAATYDLWSRERERGIAAMVLSQPIGAGTLIAGKAVARSVLVLLPATAVILAVAVLAGARTSAGLFALAATVLAYGNFWLLVAVIISLVARRSTEAAIAAGAVWLFVVVMAPSLTLAVVDLAAPAPSEMRFATELKARVIAVTEQQRRQREANPAPVRTPAPLIPDAVRNATAERLALDAELQPVIAEHKQAKAARRHLLDAVRFVLPSVAVQDALDRIAGSDADRALAFESQVLAAQQELRRLHLGYLERDALQTAAEFEVIPHFRFQETGGAFQAGVLADLVALAAAMSLLLVAARLLRHHASTP